MSMILNYFERLKEIEKEEKERDENEMFIDRCVYYNNLLNDYTIKLFYGGLDSRDYIAIKYILGELREINSNYLYDELIDIEKRFEKLYVELESVFGYDIVYDLICRETSLVHLVYTNNQYEKIRFYSKDSFMFLCQFHVENTSSMGVTSSKGLYFCFGCGVSGNAIDYIMRYENMSYEEAVGLLSRIYLIDLDFNVVPENNKLIEEYRKVLLSDDFRKLLDSSYDRFIKNNGVDRFTNVEEKYQKIIKTVERVKNNEHIKYRSNKDKPKKLVYDLYNN